MEVHNRVPMCDITSFIGRLPGEKEQFQGKMSRRSTRNIGKKVDYNFKEIKNSKEDDIKNEATNMSENEGCDSQDNLHKFKLRKRLKKDVKEENASESDDSEEESVKRKDKFSRVEDSGDEDYNVDSDDDWSDSGYKTKNSKEREEPKTKRILTEYEQMVERNRAEKMAFLKSLKFDEVKESLSEAVQSLKEKHKPVKRVSAPKEPSGPVRKSLRVLRKHSGLDYSEEALVARMEAVQNEEIRKVCKEYSNLDYKTTEPFNEHVSHFQTMQLPESQIAKVVGARITSMAFHPMKENILLAASSKYGQIGFWKVNSDQDSFVFVPHTEGITNLRFNPKLPQFIVSSSYDGTLRCGDLEKAVFNEVHNVSEETCCTFFDFLSHSTFLIGQKNGIVSVVDHREKLRAACKNHRCHDVSVKSVSVHPVDNSYFVTAGNRGSVKLWDLRKLQNQPIVEVQHHKRCVQSAYFSPLTGKHVLTTSSDDSICLFDSSNLGKSLLLEHSLKHTYQGSKSTWLPNTDNAFVVGSVRPQKIIEVYNDKMENIFNLADENVYSQTVTNVFHPSLPVIAGSGAQSGRVFVFSSGGVK
ncbi:hypothetical protein JTE90_024050 [Oedothorax gibbosus]|uniref:WD repeat-containing protein 76 n=1 Tax=Oedothorax gibbosus TaxID=931172 RepID=A0AAV6VCC4_9ARAC|nr:hypothetical protein JTE90_024050 [Oedothorax gibbosus]